MEGSTDGNCWVRWDLFIASIDFFDSPLFTILYENNLYRMDYAKDEFISFRKDNNGLFTLGDDVDYHSIPRKLHSELHSLLSEINETNFFQRIFGLEHFNYFWLDYSNGFLHSFTVGSSLDYTLCQYISNPLSDTITNVFIHPGADFKHILEKGPHYHGISAGIKILEKKNILLRYIYNGKTMSCCNILYDDYTRWIEFMNKKNVKSELPILVQEDIQTLLSDEVYSSLTHEEFTLINKYLLDYLYFDIARYTYNPWIHNSARKMLSRRKREDLLGKLEYQSFTLETFDDQTVLDDYFES
ncbi:MAG: hypothetical protein ACXAD7_02025 [Candidatus Kariarchaeaceae archaeon]|jgi:hypothetical protein